MPTSSIIKNFIIDEDQVETFINAIEASANDKTPRIPINITYLHGAEEIVEFMKKRKRNIWLVRKCGLFCFVRKDILIINTFF